MASSEIEEEFWNTFYTERTSQDCGTIRISTRRSKMSKVEPVKEEEEDYRFPHALKQEIGPKPYGKIQKNDQIRTRDTSLDTFSPKNVTPFPVNKLNTRVKKPKKSSQH